MVGGRVAILSVRPLREDERDSWTPRQELREAPAGGSCLGHRWGWLQGIFLTQRLNPRLNPGLLHCRRILYSLSYQGSSGNVY